MVTRLPQIEVSAEVCEECVVSNKNNGIKRQLTAAYTPQQNGACDRNNRTLPNMKCCTYCTKYDFGGSMERMEAEVFYEENFWQWNKKVAEKQVSTNFDGIDDEESQKPAEHDQLDSTDGPINPPSLSTTLDNEEIPQRTRRKPTWMTNHEVTGINKSDDLFTYFALFFDCDPTFFEEAINDPKWKRAMDEEIEAIEQNNTCELTDLAKGHKTKLKVNGEIDKYKARLVAKGYK
ncbi:Retrovirus-related Pol polyprotein from transposon TNT 1-94 [Cucumis melo var. makuwa]|uniref:Retrovirus-related Pol polyprotein from transposon TNT 1-94 n=1 Tax=Cucumis melo var. makuwa TaxID=1194695 RepID=A0A5A7TBV8_CUCMM|nr:Retrovirus-related Pol polyprotein from transposon TNT 1-94 [Cucumis melo var. makuwa]TYJ99738.1 Retrovirus-related Pol polyprotein from transposon TNT 1-94 [Cucumis melo var. makuwa]